jgi:hypothetical protein
MSTESIHIALRRARSAHASAEHDLAVLLCRLHASRLYAERGHSSVVQYAEVELDLTPRHTMELVAIGRKLPKLPALAAAFATGQLGWTKARELIKVATAETDEEWVARARTTTSRDLEALVAHTRPGEKPPDTRTQLTRGPVRSVLRFELDVADAEIVRRALRLLRLEGEHGVETSDAQLLTEMARRLLASEDAPQVPAPAAADTRYRVVVHTGRSEVAVPHVGETEVDPATAEMAACDAELLTVGPASTNATAASEPSDRLTHVVSPAVRRRVIHRFGDRCAVPHCRSRQFLDIHHVVPRSQGPTWGEGGLLPLCPMHHRAIHERTLLLVVTDGTARFCHADGQPFGPGAEPAGVNDAAPDALERLREALDGPGRTSAEAAHHAGLSHGRAAHLLSVLYGLGEVVVTPLGEWHRVDRALKIAS